MLSKNCNEQRLRRVYFASLIKIRQKVKIIERKVSYVEKMATRGGGKENPAKKRKKKKKGESYIVKKKTNRIVYFFFPWESSS